MKVNRKQAKDSKNIKLLWRSTTDKGSHRQGLTQYLCIQYHEHVKYIEAPLYLRCICRPQHMHTLQLALKTSAHDTLVHIQVIQSIMSLSANAFLP